MGYSYQNFKEGMVLTHTHLINIEEGIMSAQQGGVEDLYASTYGILPGEVDSTKMKELLTLASTNNKTIRFNDGEYIFSETIVVPSNVSIIGNTKTVFKAKTETTPSILMSLTNADNVFISHITLDGGLRERPTNEGTQIGMSVASCRSINIENTEFVGWSKQGLYSRQMSSYGNVVDGKFFKQFQISNCRWYFNYIGNYFDYRCEYSQLCNCLWGENYIGTVNCGGNNAYVGCQWNANQIGFKMENSGSNPAHGGCNGCTFNHNYANAIQIDDCVNGWTFEGCQVFYGSVVLNNCKGVVFNGNQVRATTNWTMGAAIATANDLVIADNGHIVINNNTCINYNAPFESDVEGGGINAGGALAVGVIGYAEAHISYNHGDVEITNNGVAVQNGSLAVGGAIYGYGVSIVGNDGDVTFAGNFESCAVDSPTAELFGGGGTSLRSVVVGEGRFELAAEEGKSITFYDSIYVAANDEMVVFNGYGDAMNGGNVKVSTGDIIFSGARTEQDLAAVQEYLKSQNFEAAESNVQASRTSVISRDIMLAAGSLQVKDGAVLRVGAMDGTEGNMLYLIDGQREAGSFGVTYPEGHMPELVVSAGSRIEAGSITFDSNTMFTVTGASASIEDAATFSLQEAAPVAEIQANTVTMMGGMTYTQDGAYTLMVGDGNTLIIDVSNGLTFNLNLDDSVAHTEGEMSYFVLFTDVETLSLVGADSWDEVSINYNFGGNYEDPTMGYDAATGTLYVAAKSAPIPEPTTATLSLLALVGLAARRRRK